MRSTAAASIFFSYARRDGVVAEQVFNSLEAAGLTVYRDTEEILPAEDWRERLEGLITRADGIVFVMSSNSVRSPVCAWEVEVAARLNKRIVPLVVEDAGSASVPPQLERLNWIFATPGRDFDAAIAKTVEACTTDIGWVRLHTTLGERALEWERAGRPRGVRILRGDELAEAEAWLSAQPDSAPPPTALQRAWIGASRRAATRRQRGWMAGSLSVAAVSIGLGIFAEINRQIAAEQRDRAELILDRGSQTANDLVFDLAQRFRDREGVPQDLVREMLERSRALVDQLALAGENRPDLLRSRAAALAEMSLTLARQGDPGAALSAAEDALASFDALIAAEPKTAQWRIDRIAALDRLGDIRHALGHTDEARTAYAGALSAARAAPPDTAARRQNLATALEKIGTLSLEDGDFAAARAAFDEALALRRAGPGGGAGSRGEAVLLERNGDAGLAENDVASAASAYRKSLEITRRLAAEAPTDTLLARDLSVIHQKLGDLLVAGDEPEAALEHFLADADIARRLRADDPDRREWAEDLLVSEDRLGSVHALLGETGPAVEAFARAHAMARSLAQDDLARAPDHDRASRTAQKLSLAQFAAGDAAAARATAEVSAADLRAAAGLDAGVATGLYAAALNNVAWYALFAGDPVASLAAAEEALALGPGEPGYALNRAHALMLAGRPEVARAAYLQPPEGIASPDWAAMIADDFDVLRAQGIETALMDAVLAEIGTNRGG